MKDMSRREFIKRGGAAGTLLGLPPFLLSCGGDQSTTPRTETRSLFFNLAHENAPHKNYFLVANGQTYQLTEVRDAPQVLNKARLTNRFLSLTPNDQITHHLENVVMSADSVTLCYIGSPINGQPGAWAMSMIYLHIPNSGSDYAFKAATDNVPLSNKRAFYRQPAAKSPEDLRAENALIDCHDHAASLIMLNPGLLSAESNSAHYIYTNHVGTGSLTNRLANTLRNLGPAQPQQSGNQPNPSGWATLQVLSDQHHVPIINPHNKLIQYFPDWHPEIDLYAAPAMTFHINNVRNDTNLGATIVRGGSDQDIKGKIWFQRDGFTTIEPNSSQRAAVNGDHVALTIAGQSPDPGLDVTANVSQSGSNVTLNLNFSNSFLRYLGVYAQFLDDKKQPIPLAQLSGYPDHIQTNHNTVLDTKTEMFLVTLDPELTILGIPVAAGTSAVSINVPIQARQVRILSSGLSIGNIAPNRYPETVSAGIAMTIIINYAFTIAFMAAGAASAAATLQGFVRTLGILVVEDSVELIEDLIDQGDSLDTPGGWKDMGIITAKLLAKPGAVNVGKILLSLVEYVIGIIGAAAAASAIPIIGQIQRAIACIVGVADMIHTTLDLAMSPWTYVTDLVLTHDVSVSLLPDPNNGHFPAQATQYKVTAMFENGTPYVQILALNSRGPKSLPPVVFSNVPLGGKANISVAFLQQGQDDVLLGKGSTGLIDNDASAQPVITIEQLEFPINANTTYQHQQKTTLTGNRAAPTHQWFITKTAPTATSTNNGNQPGDLSLLESITVRQATSKPPVNGYIGYSWRAFSSGIADCSSNAVNQLDQIANLNSLSAQAQTGYVVSRCGLPGGVKIAYSLLSHSTTNFYLDTSIDTGTNLPRNLIRRIQLDPTPRFDDPNSNLAWGKLNFSSTALLLHPAGKLISISVIDHQIETLALPDEAVSDRQANQELLALRHGGLGNLPGLLSSPIAAAISPDGVLFVLEQGNHRIQALDVNGNPVSYFSAQSQPYFLNLDATGDTQFLDLAVEYTGFLYVLSYDQAKQIYRMDIYHPKQTGTAPISTTQNINAGRLTVDFWRNVYTLNFEVLQLNGIPAVTEPSVSLWTPCVMGNTC